MRLVVVGVVVVVALMLLMYLRARSIVRRHSVTLSHITGIPSDVIAREMTDGNLTPGEWARQHGLDPMTFQPRGG